MEHLLKRWAKLTKDYPFREILLCLDYDGTLSPIVQTPSKALLSFENKALLELLSKSARCRVAVISGRALGDVREKVGLKNVIYVGNHGFEINGPDTHFESLCLPELKSVLREIKKDLLAALASYEGILIEDKGVTMSIHYRMVSDENQPLVKKAFYKVCQPYQKEGKIKIFTGKKVFEVRPPILWDKGLAVLWLLNRFKIRKPGVVMPIYIGDDETDEDAFEVLAGKGLTILVNDSEARPSQAKYYLNGPEEVTMFLKQMVELIKNSA